MLKIILWVIGFFALLAVVYFVGPKPTPAQLDASLPAVASDLSQLESDINRKERQVQDLKPDNAARIVWADTANKVKTPYSIVYIHGFGASWAEGEPVHKELAARYGANLYLARMHDAGIADSNAFDDLTPENFVAGANEALAIGKQLGDSVIVIGTSAGGLLTVFLASEHPELKGVVLYAPCMAVANPALKLTTGPWGKQILKTVIGEHSISKDEDPLQAQYWLQGYNTNGLLTLQKTMDAVARPDIYEKITVPLFLGYYYKNEEEQDPVVSVEAMRKMFPLLGTPEAQKREVAFPDVADHVIASYIRSKDVESVYQATDQFFQEILGLTPVERETVLP
ncbi:esterase/lipase [Dyadobacter jejuensis]|uniref:Esterase/lipase n=1 Tax=Dyadobacter jejuensis TaxID=1082580 RepID=A0A316AG55_9BACT|nr:alpha/beta fold hydrolase [Dyadobacter jejuensis]PWJ56572.1 esterase/lipase [Dyadobacter jejuensis]